MPFRILVADDDENVRKSHKFAIDAASELLKDKLTVVESDDSVDALAKIKSEHFDLIIVDNDFKDKEIHGHLPGVALIQIARREGVNTNTPIVFCSAETFETLKPMVEKFKADHDDYNAIMAEALADRLAEAFAEYLHKRVREEWGYGKAEKLTTEDLIGEKYRGIRPAAGYPACPDHTEKGILWQLLDVEKNAGIRLTESFAMWPGSSVSGLYFAHPESKYFAVGKLGRDQLLEYHVRKSMTLQEAERWLGPYLNYEPGKAAAPAK